MSRSNRLQEAVGEILDRHTLRTNIWQRIVEERNRQERLRVAGKFPFSCADAEITHPERLAVLVEEVGEVGHEVNEAIGRPEALNVIALRAELIQVAAVCVAWLEAMESAR